MYYVFFIPRRASEPLRNTPLYAINKIMPPDMTVPPKNNTDTCNRIKKLLIERIRTSNVDSNSISRAHRLRLVIPLYLADDTLFDDLDPGLDIKKSVSLQYLHNRSRNELIKRQAVEISRVFNDNDIEVLLLKGSALLFTLYKNDPGARMMSDLDILVHKKNIQKAENILKDMGWTEDYELCRKQTGTTLTKENIADYYSHYIYHKNNIWLEMHWGFSTRSDTKLTDKLFKTSQKVSMDMTPVTIPGPAGSIFCACRNFIKDNTLFQPQDGEIFYTQLFLLYELDRILGFYGHVVNWQDLVFLIRCHKRRYLFNTLFWIGSRSVGLKIPESFLREGRSHPFTLLYLHLSRNLKPEQLPEMFKIRQRIILSFESIVRRSRKFVKIVFLAGPRRLKRTFRAIFGRY